ncbi:MAG: SUF system NifU family Fe-S cluster assembly protein [Parvibaculum sp.]|nr:SUF system NifU family Fe-S cluster assembly protein [Parvibaculum sp.]
MIDPDLRDLYQEVILDHGRNPRHFGTLPNANHEAQGHNPLCGDRIHLFLRVDPSGRIDDVAFEGKGCAISIASASMMTDLILGKTVTEAHSLAAAFYHLAKGEPANEHADEEDMERIAVMSGVSQFPMRVKCATLAWHTFEDACAREAGGGSAA